MTETAAALDRISIRLAHSLDDMGHLLNVAESVWGPPAGSMVSPDFLMALSHTGGYVAVAELSGSDSITTIGASFGFLARHRGDLALHSHITGVLPDHQHLGVGFRLKQHQRSWALAHDLRVITWTFDPLVRRNAWFNLHRLGATAEEYFVNFYGALGDSINGTDETDRLLARWDLRSARATAAEHGSLNPVIPGPSDRIIAIPKDIVAMRRTDPRAAQSWRVRLRHEFQDILNDHQIIGLSPAGEYVLTSRAAEPNNDHATVNSGRML